MERPLDLRNPALERMRAGGAALGMIVRLGRSGDIARIAHTTGHDFIIVDLQHAVFAGETVGHIAQAAQAAGVASLVRVPHIDDPNIVPLLDSGSNGIVFPDVRTPEDARRCVRTSRFPPLGQRSVSGLQAAFNFRAVPPAESMRLLNTGTLVACMIETVEAVENVDEIARVDGIDVLHIGAGDLLTDMGKPGRTDDPQLTAAIERVISAARAHAKFAGLGGVRDLGRQIGFLRGGIQFLTTNSDIAFLLAAAAERARALRAALT